MNSFCYFFLGTLLSAYYTRNSRMAVLFWQSALSRQLIRFHNIDMNGQLGAHHVTKHSIHLMLLIKADETMACINSDQNAKHLGHIRL